MPKQLKKWEVTRQKGKGRFILLNGVVSWGIPMFVLMTFVLNRGPEIKRTPSMILISALIWILGGVMFGGVTWFFAERKYQKFIATQNRS